MVLQLISSIWNTWKANRSNITHRLYEFTTHEFLTLGKYSVGSRHTRRVLRYSHTRRVLLYVGGPNSKEKTYHDDALQVQKLSIHGLKRMINAVPPLYLFTTSVKTNKPMPSPCKHM